MPPLCRPSARLGPVSVRFSSALRPEEKPHPLTNPFCNILAIFASRPHAIRSSVPPVPDTFSDPGGPLSIFLAVNRLYTISFPSAPPFLRGRCSLKIFRCFSPVVPLSVGLQTYPCPSALFHRVLETAPIPLFVARCDRSSTEDLVPPYALDASWNSLFALVLADLVFVAPRPVVMFSLKRPDLPSFGGLSLFCFTAVSQVSSPIRVACSLDSLSLVFCLSPLLPPVKPRAGMPSAP